MNNQIEEMALDIHSASSLPLELCGALATDLAEKGYHKQIEGEWIEHIEKPSWLEDDVEVYYNCSVCGTSHWSITPPFCPNCGARMKGEQ